MLDLICAAPVIFDACKSSEARNDESVECHFQNMYSICHPAVSQEELCAACGLWSLHNGP